METYLFLRLRHGETFSPFYKGRVKATQTKIAH
jgi:hypothetical protein